jgi:hypothetical protein
MAEVIIKNTRDLTQLAKDLRQASNAKELRKQFTTEVRGALRPVVVDVKAAYRAAASGGHASATRARQAGPDLRGLLAKATLLQVRTSGKQAGVSVKVAGKKMPLGMRSLPRYWEGEATTAGRGRWRHPVYGRRTDPWVQQPSRRTFDPAVQPHVPQVVAAVNRAADTVRRKLEHPGATG